MPKSKLRILMEMRPALDGHAGIPQETRLLFRGLSMLEGVTVEGLLQHGGHVLAQGLPPENKPRRSLSADEQLNRLGRVVISLDKSQWPYELHAAVHTFGMAFWAAFGGTQPLSRFEARHFQDFVWNKMFARTLPAEDFERITGANFRIMHVPWSAMHICADVTRYTGGSIYARLDTSAFDLMIVETPYPAKVSGRTQLIVRYHDAIPMLMPHTIANRSSHRRHHFRTLRMNVAQRAWFVCVSDSTRNDLLSIFPEAEPRSVTIHNMVSHHYFNEDSNPARVNEILSVRLNNDVQPPLDIGFIRNTLHPDNQSTPVDYLLVVSTIEPRKNYLTLLSAWERMRVERFPSLKLVVVGALGWHHEAIARKIHPWLERGEVFFLCDVPSADLRLLYKHARATICPSYGEGFGFSGVEAMMSGGAVVASAIAAHNEIYADAAEFFNPYSVDDLERAICSVTDPAQSARRAELIAKGASIAERYSQDAILPQWESFLETAQSRREAR
jgi:glycosyltransferase involved in cell wall biosynthesis